MRAAKWKKIFIDFLHFDKKKGHQISEAILQKLKTDGIDISDCRGQGYDNGSNMSGIYNGVQAHIKRTNKHTEYLQCAAHSLNLVGQNATTKVLTAKITLREIQSLYNFYSSSPDRWNLLKPHVKKVLKFQSQTRWSAKAAALSALLEGYEGVVESLSEIVRSDATNSSTLVDATAHFNQINNFRFLLGLKIWNEILQRINITSVALQKTNMDIDSAS